ncbi:MAG TPA: hypothetical protein VF625_16880 [Longimicrobium sp.]|jgi:translation initiation factor IF-1
MKLESLDNEMFTPMGTDSATPAASARAPGGLNMTFVWIVREDGVAVCEADWE